MKRFLVLSGALLLLVVAGAAVFLLTFDADRYRPRVVARLETALGRAVQLERISLRWHGGLAADLKKLAIYPGRGREGGPALRAENVIAQLRLIPLLRGEVQLVSVWVIGPEMRLLRTPDGAMRIEGITPLPETSAPTASPSPSTTAPSPAVQAIPLVIRQLGIREGTVHIRDLSVRPPVELTLEQVSGVAELDLRSARLEFRDFTAQVGGGSISAEGGLRDFYTRPKGSVRVKTQGIALEQLAPGARQAGQPSLQGRMSSALELSFEGTPGPELLRSVSGEGSLRLQEARLVDMNLLREIFDRVSILPGLTETLLSRLPPSTQEKLNTPNTRFGPVDVDFSLSRGLLSLGDLKLTSDSFELTGSGGKVGLDGQLELPAQIRIEPELSKAFIQSVEELKYLTDEKQRIVIPLLLQGTLQRFSVAPDLQYLTSKLLVTRAEDLVGDLLNRVLEKNLKKEEQPAQ